MEKHDESAELAVTEKVFGFGKPLGDRIIVLSDDVAKQTKTGIIIPENARERPQLGTVLALGTALTENIKVGDRILFGKYAGVPISIQEKIYYVMREREVFMVMNEEETDMAQLNNMTESKS